MQSPAEIEKSVSDLELVDKKEKPEKPPRARNRQMGWGSSPSAEVEEVVDARLIQRDDDEEDETELQFIPDLDEIQEEDMVQEVAAPPQAFNKDIATYRYVFTCKRVLFCVRECAHVCVCVCVCVCEFL